MDGWDPMQEEYRNSGGRKGNVGSKSNTFSLYIANIPMHMNKAGVGQLFEKYGKVVDCFVGVAQKRGRQYQFGKVSYGSYPEAEMALREMNETPPLNLKVSFWKSKDGDNQSSDGAIANARNPGSMNNGNSRTTGLSIVEKGDSDTSLNTDNGNVLTFLCTTCSAPATFGCRLCWTPYCSQMCQKLGWEQHQAQCAQLAKRYENAGLLQEHSQNMKSQEPAKVTHNERNALNAVAPVGTQAKDTVKPSAGPNASSTSSRSEIFPWVKAAFPQDARVKAQIAHINSPSSFYIQQCDQTKLCEVMAVMQDVEERGAPVCRRDAFKVGSVVAAQYSDELWYRAKVEKVLPNSMADIVFLDFGNKEIVNLNSLRAVPASLKEVPYQTVHCCLSGFSSSEEYPDELVQKFKSMSEGEISVVNVGQESGKLLVRLESSKAAGGSVNDLLRKDLQNNLPFKMKSLLDVLPDDSLLRLTMVLPNENNTFWCLGHVNPESDMMLLLVGSKNLTPDKSRREWKVMDFAFAMSKEYSVWYRAQILEILKDGRYIVHYVDYGNLEIVTELTPLEGRYKEIPCLGILCRPRMANVTTGDIIEGIYTTKHGKPELTITNMPGLKLQMRAFNHPEVTKSLLNTAAGIKPCPPAPKETPKVSSVQKPLNGATDPVKFTPEKVAEDYSLSVEQLKDFKYDHLPESTEVDVVSVESSRSMYLHAKQEVMGDLVILQATLNEYLNKNESSMPPVRGLRIGNLVCTRFKDDDMWYRVAVENIVGDVVTVRYVDYGNVESVPRDCIVAIPQQFMLYPKMAIHVAVAGAPDDIKTFFLMKERIFNRKYHPIRMTIVDPRARPVSVHLITNDGRKLTAPEQHHSSASSHDSKTTVIQCIMQNPFIERRSDGHSASALKRSPSQSSSVSSKSVEASTQTESPSANLEKQLSPGNKVVTVPSPNVPTASHSPKAACEGLLVAQPDKCSKPKTYTLEDATTCKLPVGEEITLTVLEVRTPELVYLWQPEKQAMALNKMDEEIHKYCSALSEVPHFKPAFGELCLAKFSAAQRWYRGSVMVFGLEESLVYFVDYGNMEYVRNFNMVPMIDRFMELPHQAIQCRIDGCYTDRDWSKDILNNVIDANDQHLVKVVSFDELNYVYSVQFPSLTKQLKGIDVLRPDY